MEGKQFNRETESEKEVPAEALATARHELGEHNGINMSIEASNTFTFKDSETMNRAFQGEVGPKTGIYIYSRHLNPTVLNLGRQIAAIEGTETGYCTASGMSAISSVLLHLCNSGGHVVAAKSLYGGSHALLTHFLQQKCNITTTFVDIVDLEEVENAMIEGKTSVLYFESISNPTLNVANIPELSKIAHAKGVKVVVDNTFAPMILSPAKLGADVVVHSISKYMSGEADIIAGAICGPAEIVDQMRDPHEGPLMVLGPTMNPKLAFEISGRIPHLSMRMKKHCKRAMKFVTKIKELDPNLVVLYPGLEEHPQHSLLKSMSNKDYGFGGVFCVDMKTEERANLLMDKLQNNSKFGFMGVSLGYYETLMTCSSSSTNSMLDDKEKERAGISPGLIRFSVGYVGTFEQKWSQFTRAYSEM
ncbi:TRANS-SULFURATION ENZYME FAMILY MEMBER [Salix koriyanagi]|uniref:TRANS-SULFURATION ENZYME FAMILY MEMBER n=1 Tax=Salix koriyanagi TaxID=2511006 RepID=A0A9Q0PVK1_9ROSI|nr:TRANS-SULFURATION ENZYME FAMILY MEMBER [Salix koriyanagi]